MGSSTLSQHGNASHVSEPSLYRQPRDDNTVTDDDSIRFVAPIPEPTSDSDDEDNPPPRVRGDVDDEKPVTWLSLPKKSQLAILTFARLSEPVAQTSLQAYMFYQLKSFDPSLPDSTISAQAGMLQACFTAAQFFSAVFWGRLADADCIGRKRVLMVGLLGTSVSCLGFGFSRSFITAGVFRTLGGMLNSNMGVMRTMIAEMIEEKKYQSRAFLLLPICFNIGVIIGPIFGGMLADPAGSYPGLFGPGSVFGGNDGVWWMLHWPFALPNVLSAVFIFCSLSAVILGLDETHEVARYRGDWGRKLGRKLARTVSCNRAPRGYRALAIYDGDDYNDYDAENRSIPPSPSRIRTPRPLRSKRPTVRQTWTRNILLTLLANFLLAFHTSAFNSMTFTFLPAPRAPGHTQHGIHFGGGLGLPSSRVGLATAIIGIIGLPLQILIYPSVQSRLGTLPCFRAFLPCSSLAYFLMPFLVLIPPTMPILVWISFTAVVSLQVISRTFTLPAGVILVNNAVTNPAVLGTIHGVAQSVTSLARTLGPFVGGWGLGLGLQNNFIIGVWCFLAVEALVGWGLLWSIYEGGGIQKKRMEEPVPRGFFLEGDGERVREGR